MLEQIYACLQKCPFLHQLNNEKNKCIYIYVFVAGMTQEKHLTFNLIKSKLKLKRGKQ